MIPKITQAHIDAAKAAGACSVPYKVGTLITDLSAEHAEWIEKNLPALAKTAASAIRIPGLRGIMPLSLLIGPPGDGYGSGYGYGYGSGSGR